MIKIEDSTIAGNEAGDNGGGIYASIYGTSGGGTDEAKLTNVTISGNASDRSGGGVYQYVGQVSLLSSTVTANTADADASGADDHGGAALRQHLLPQLDRLRQRGPGSGRSLGRLRQQRLRRTQCDRRRDRRVKADGDRTGNPSRSR